MHLRVAGTFNLGSRDGMSKADFAFAFVEAMQATHILRDRSPPRNRQREEQGVQPRVVESLADVPPGGEQESIRAKCVIDATGPRVNASPTPCTPTPSRM